MRTLPLAPILEVTIYSLRNYSYGLICTNRATRATASPYRTVSGDIPSRLV